MEDAIAFEQTNVILVVFGEMGNDGAWGMEEKLRPLEVKADISYWLGNYIERSWDLGRFETGDVHFGVIWVHNIFKDRLEGISGKDDVEFKKKRGIIFWWNRLKQRE